MKTIKISLIIFVTLLFVKSSFAIITLDTIYGTQEENYIKIEWQTSLEINNDYFTIERSTDSISYTQLNNVDGFGQSSTIKTYSYTDSTITLGQTYFYRIKQTDFDATSTYSNAIQIVTETITGINNLPIASFQIYPNPTVNSINLTFSNYDNSSFNLKIFDIEGRVVRSIYNIRTDKMIIPRDNLKNGMYILKIYSNNLYVASKKLMIQ